MKLVSLWECFDSMWFLAVIPIPLHRQGQLKPGPTLAWLEWLDGGGVTWNPPGTGPVWGWSEGIEYSGVSSSATHYLCSPKVNRSLFGYCSSLACQAQLLFWGRGAGMEWGWVSFYSLAQRDRVLGCSGLLDLCFPCMKSENGHKNGFPASSFFLADGYFQ